MMRKLEMNYFKSIEANDEVNCGSRVTINCIAHVRRNIRAERAGAERRQKIGVGKRADEIPV